MISYKQFILENQQYLTDPYDSEMSLDYDLNITELHNKIKKGLENLSKKLGLEVYTIISDNDSDVVFQKEGFYNYVLTICWDYRHIYVKDKQGFSHFYKTLEDVENELINHFKLNTNENQQYLTDPYDPEAEVYYELDGIKKYHQLYKNMESLSNYLGLTLMDVMDSRLKEYFKFINPSNNKEYRFYIRFDLSDIHLKDESGETNYTTLDDVKKKLVKELKLKINENQRYLTDPYDPDNSSTMRYNNKNNKTLLEYFNKHMKSISTKLNIKIEIMERDSVYIPAVYKFYKKDLTKQIDFKLSNLGSDLYYITDYTDIRTYNTFGEIEEKIKEELDINESIIKNYTQFLLEKKKEKESPKDCIMLSTDIKNWKKDYLDKIDEDDIYDTKDKDYGLETMPHITVVYGLLADEISKQIKEEEIYPLLENLKPFEISGVSISLFENEDYDVLKIDVEPNKELLKLRKKLLEYPNEQSYKDYHPHITISYLKKGKGKKYIKKMKLDEPIVINIDKSIYSDSKYKKKYFTLNSK